VARGNRSRQKTDIPVTRVDKDSNGPSRLSVLGAISNFTRFLAMGKRAFADIIPRGFRCCITGLVPP
jgi:hypothetical protein